MVFKRINKGIATLLLSLSLMIPSPSYAFINPADTAALLQILANGISQLIELKNMIDTARNKLELMKDLNSGIDVALGALRTAYPDKALELYSDWKSSSGSRKKFSSIYGEVVKSSAEVVQKHLDQSILDAIVQNNKTMDSTSKIDSIGEKISSQSQGASPKGAARLSAQALGVGLHVQNQSLRVQASQLKLDAQTLAAQNKKDKEEARVFMKSSQLLKKGMQSQKDSFKTPRF